ncbi:M15 family metallopeptidase [Candidatus Pacearchaeota archaeon]|nr:M15 family metallopeptidase [Candidatus Pacearchaeota archaeon]
MASRNIEDLAPDVQVAANLIVGGCANEDVDIMIYGTLRPLEEQAILYRQSRSWEQIKRKIEKFRNRGLDFLADILENAGPCHGPKRTNAAPGESWHNYAEAFDAVPMVGGKPAWKYKDAPFEWAMYGEMIKEAGLNWSGDWKRFKEIAHAQKRHGSNPLKEYSPNKIQEMLITNGLLEA